MSAALGRWAAPLALALLVLAVAWPMQVNGFNQNAHYALIRALAKGSPSIDRTIHEIGEVSTGDTARYHGHLYATRAPGLAAASLPAYGVVSAVGMRTTGDTTRVIWALHLFALVLAYAAIVVLVRRLGDRVAPGYGTAAAVFAGVGTLLLPFGTLFFSHVPAAALAFAAFAVLWRERERPQRLGLVAAGGALAGLAFTTEYPLVFGIAVLAPYAVLRSDPLRRLVAYGAGTLAGVAPLIAFNLWAFRNPFHIPHEDFFNAPEHGTGGYPLGLGWPRVEAVRDLLFSSMGLLVLCPVVACGAVGTVLMWRRGFRAEALVVAAISLVYLLYPAGLRSVSPFGGLGPPRYLVTMLPFLAVGLAPALRRFPRTTLALAVVSGVQMAVQTATGPLAAYDGQWVDRLRARQFVETGAALVGVTGWIAVVPFFLALLGAAALAAATLGRQRAPAAEAGVALLATAAWAVVALTGPHPTGLRPGSGYVLAITVVAVALGLVLAGVSVRPLRRAVAGA